MGILGKVMPCLIPFSLCVALFSTMLRAPTQNKSMEMGITVGGLSTFHLVNSLD